VEDRRELAKLVYLRGRIILDELDSWDEGVWYRNPDVAFPPNVARCSLLPPASSAMPGAPTAPAGRPALKPGEKAPAPEKKLTWRETYLTAEQEAFLHAQMPRYISVNREKGRDLATLGLSNREKEYLKAIVEKPMQVSFAMSISPLTRTVTQRMIVQLLQMGIFNLSETNPEGIAEVLPGDLHRYLVEMKMLHEFDVIAAHATSTQDEIERRYQKTIAIFDERYYQNITPEQRADLQEIRRRIEEAAAKLRDPVRRREIRERIWDKLQIDNFYDIQIKKARIALQMRRDGEAALLLASSALELRPHSAEAFGLVNGARQLLRGRSLPPSGG